MPNRRCLPFVALLLALVTPACAAFTFSDGKTDVCYAQGQPVTEVFAAPDDPTMQNRTGRVTKVAGRWQLTWNAARLKSLPADLRDFIFFHECAHAQVPTEVEFDANCAGLIEMRAAGRATPTFEARLKRLYASEPYWIDTFKCADIYAERQREKAQSASPPK